MKRLTLFIAVALLATLAPMGSASARGDGWTFLEAADFTAPACGTDIAETFVANKEYAKFAVDADGVLHFIVVTGVLKVRVTDTATGHDALLYPNGDFLFTAAGPALFILTSEEAADTGLPTLFLNSGNLVILFKADGSAEVQRLTGHLTDLCAALT